MARSSKWRALRVGFTTARRTVARYKIRRSRAFSPSGQTILEERVCPSTFYDFGVVARSGVGPYELNEIGRGVSINDFAINEPGYIAFVADSENPEDALADNIYSFNTQTKSTNQLLHPIYMYPKAGSNDLTPGTQSIFEEVEINNSGLILARRRLNIQVLIGLNILTAPFTYLETWDAGGSVLGVPTHKIAVGDAGTPPFPLAIPLNPPTGFFLPSLWTPGPYLGIYPPSTLNNVGQVNFSAIVNNEGNNRISSDINGSLIARGPIGDLSVWPDLADSSEYALSTSDNRLFLERWDQSSLLLLAGPTTGFPAVGRPAITDDGDIVVFYGELTREGAASLNAVQANLLDPASEPLNLTPLTPGPGIFMSVDSASGRIIQRVAGSGANGDLDPFETFVDTNGNSAFDPGVEVDTGEVLSYPPGTRVNVTINESDPTHSLVTIAFTGLNASGSMTIFTTQFQLPRWSDGRPIGDVLPINQSVVVSAGQTIGDRDTGNRHIIEDLAIHDSLNSSGQLAFWAHSAGQDLVLHAIPARTPVFILGGIGADFPLPEFAEVWYLNRGIDPQLLQLEPIYDTYVDLIQSLVNAGYRPGVDLYVANYDWRMDPGPPPTDGTFDGNITGGMTALHITTADETGEFRYGVDYLGYWMKKAVFDWEERFPDRPLESIDVIAHSTGGLVTRAYIQSPAYNQTFDNAGHTLPRIRKFVMYDVPNQGAAKAWGFLKNTWMGDGSALDAASYNATSKLVSNAFRKMLDGEPIRGADRNITLDELLETVPSERRWLVTYDLQNDTDWSGREAEEIRRRFIDQFCPTIRSLLSTYPFLRDENGTLIDVNLDQNQRNNLLLDLNGRSTDMNWFATQVESVINVYANGVSTITERTELTGTLLPSGDLQVGFHETIPTHPDWGEIWYRADIDAHGGDGTVPYVSLVGQFLDDPRVLKLEFVIDPTFATPNFGRSDLVTTLLPGDPSDPAKTISHTTIVANPHVIQAILARLGHPLPIEQVSSGHQLSPRAGVWNGARLGYLDLAIDPIDAYLVDQQGRRLGYTTAEGRLEEIPGSSYFGATLGFGQLLALEDELEPISPFRLELQGSGSTFTVQVSNWYSDRFLPGLTMRGFLAPQQRMSVLVPTQDPAIPGPPQANDESVTTTTGRGIYVPVLQNDVAHNMRLDRSSVVITRFSSHGEIEVDSLTGEVLYRPEFGFTGIDSFEYMFLDQEGVSSNSGHVTIEVVSGPGNQAPLALSDHLTGSMNTLLIIDGLANDSDPDGVLRSTALSIERLPSHGTLSFDETLTRFVYVPAPDFVGDDSFAYKVRDDAGEWSNLAEVSIDVTSPSLPPTALDDDVRSESGVVTRFPVLENDFDIDGTLNPSTVTIVTQPSRGSATLDPESGEIIYTADPGASGQDLLTYFVRDDTGVASNIASVFVTLIEPSVPLELLAFDIQRGAAQRSFIRFVGLQFNSSGGLESLRASMTNESPEDDRLRLRRFELDGTGGTFAPFASSILIDGASVELDFGILGLGGNPTSALGDGHYILEVDLDGNGTFDTSRRFYRLLGDANGDHQVDDMDLALVNSALGRTGTSLEEDVNGDGVVNQIDRILVRRARGRRLGSGLIIDD